MKKPTVLSWIEVAAPCTSSWDKMEGDEKVRFCHECKLNVYNLSSVSQSEAEELFVQKEGRLCVRFYRRKDGTMLTDNCPVGLRRMRDFGRKVAAIVAFALTWIIAFGNQQMSAQEKECAKPSKSNGIPTMGDHTTTMLGRPAPYRDIVLNKIASSWKEKASFTANITIKKDGSVQKVDLLQSSGTLSIDKKVINTISAIKFDPLPPWYKKDTLTLKIDLREDKNKQ